MAQKRVAVIGAGAAGLAMCRYLVNEPQIDFVAFEKANAVAGIWRYTKENGKAINEHDITPMYKNLRTNLPKQVMAFPDLPFPNELPSFITNQDVVQYLDTYAECFGLKKYIKLNHLVTSVKPIIDGSDAEPSWDVVVKDLKTEAVEKFVFDAVVVCNGHFAVPKFPEFPGMDTFPGNVIHSLDYDKQDNYQDETVVVLGAGSSGLDIAMELSQVSKKVYLVHLYNKIASELPKNVQEISGTITACFANGSVEINHDELLEKVNAIIICTGYHYSFPFLKQECGINVKNNAIFSLYKHIFCTKYPSLAFVGICIRISPFPFFSAQAQCIASVLCGRKTLPSFDEMVKDEESDYQDRLQQGITKHLLGPERQFKYCTMLAEMTEVPCAISQTVHSLFVYTCKIRSQRLATYKNSNFVLNGNEWQTVKNVI
ncbi:flavin-containing monooxygenase FMO GS-OX-like 2 [Dendronephthya gigantea]|uniref:flavin-containing monooxygenase FMO GS-OX-like 2 n=1 Tax=Dendronephthya gigantea TaxID=151771 RepID=UPI00106BA87A|nr:flavin-containing monooxygenase FMO GS-OX-like 2 [Dendronephthya gigantea]